MPEMTELTALSDTPWQTWLLRSETQLYHAMEPEPGLFVAESLHVISRALDAGYAPVSFLIDRRQLNKSLETLISPYSVPVWLADAVVLEQIPGMHLTRGVLCAMRRRTQPHWRALCRGTHRIALLENVMNPTNLGAIFRSAAALGVDAVLLSSGCTDPLYRRAARVSMGTVFQIPWTYLDRAPSAADAVIQLREAGYRCAAMALSDRAIGIDAPHLCEAEKLVIVLGTEGTGLAPETVAACDDTVCIPMAHDVDSLNVAAASAVAFWQLCRRDQSASCGSVLLDS